MTLASRIFAVVTLASRIFAVVTLASRILTVVTASEAIALAVIAPVPISFDVMVPTFSLPPTSASVELLETIASLVNSVSSMILFNNVLVITSFVAKVLVVLTTPAILFLGNDLSICHGTSDLNRGDLRGTDRACQG